MSKRNKQNISACGSQKQRSAYDTVGEITVRAYDRRMRDRFDETKKAINILNQMYGCRDDEEAINAINISAERNIFRAMMQNVRDIAHRLESLIKRYDLITVVYLVDNTNNRQYFTVMSCENIDSILWDLCSQLRQQIDQIIDLIRVIEGTTTLTSGRDNGPRLDCDQNFESLLRVLQIANACVERAVNWSYPIFNQSRDILKCENCGDHMRMLPDVNEIVCDHCGRITFVIGLAQIDENNAGNVQSTRDVRRGGYTYMRHLRIWLDRLQAIENFEFNAEDLAKIKKSIESEHILPELINWRGIQCRDIIRHLELCGLSHLGEHTPKLVKELGGAYPPVLDYESEQIIVRDFMHIMDIYSHLYNKPGNKPYYPFFIGKIIKRRFAQNSSVRNMLSYISRQGHDTVNKNDRIYKQICESAPAQYDLIYEPEIE